MSQFRHDSPFEHLLSSTKEFLQRLGEFPRFVWNLFSAHLIPSEIRIHDFLRDRPEDIKTRINASQDF
jgi:hypothetical protein